MGVPAICVNICVRCTVVGVYVLREYRFDDTGGLHSRAGRSLFTLFASLSAIGGDSPGWDWTSLGACVYGPLWLLVRKELDIKPGEFMAGRMDGLRGPIGQQQLLYGRAAFKC